MAIAGVDTQGGNPFAALQNVSQRNQTEEARANESQDARLGTQETSETEEQQSRLGTESNLASQQGGTPDQGSGVPGQSLESSSLNALIQAAQEQDDEQPTEATDESAGTGSAQQTEEDEALQQQASAGNSTNSLAPGTPTGSADGRGISFLV